MHHSALSQPRIKTLQALPQLSIECPTISPVFLSNTFQKTFPSKILLPSNVLNMTSTPPNPAPTASSASVTSSEPTTYQYITGIVNYPTAPFITATSPCRISLAMTPQNPLAPQATEDPLPQLSSICLLKSSPRCSQAPSSHVPGYLDSLLPLPMLQYPQDPPPLPTTSSPSDKCPPDRSAAPSPATISPLTLTGPLSTDLSSPPRPAPIASSKTSPLKKRITKRSWMTVKRQSSSLRRDLSATSTPSPNHPTATSKTVALPPSLSLAAADYRTRPNGLRSSTMVEWRGTPQRTALTTSHTCARSMHPPSIQLTLRSRYLTGSMKPFKGPPLGTLPFSMPSKPQMIGGSRPMLCDSEPSTSASSPTSPNSTEPMASSKAPSSPRTNVRADSNARVLLNGFHIWLGSHNACPPATRLVGDGRRDEGVTSKGECNVIDLTNEDSSSDDEEL